MIQPDALTVGTTYRFIKRDGKELKPRTVIKIDRDAGMLRAHHGSTRGGYRSYAELYSIAYFAERALPLDDARTELQAKQQGGGQTTKPTRVTPPQLRELRYAAKNARGLNAGGPFQYGWEGCGWRKVMKALLAQGLVQFYSGGGYEITERGRDVVRSHRDSETSDRVNKVRTACQNRVRIAGKKAR